MFRIGSDPELFVQDMNGKVVSAIGLIGGTKRKPIEIKSLGKGYALQEDNVLLEYNTPPVYMGRDWVETHKKILSFIDSFLEKKGFKRRMTASEVMPEDEMQHPKAWQFGCEPDYNAWTLEKNPSPECDEPLLRTAGGHVHVGINMSESRKILLVRWMDVFLGLYGVINDPDTRRRELYGKAGAYRMKPYGVEYRTLSNFWVDSEVHCKYIFTGTTKALQKADLGMAIPESYAEMLIKAINNSEKELAKNLLESALADF